MSMIFCKHCKKLIDTDYDVEHFVDEDLTTCKEIEVDDSDDGPGEEARQMNEHHFPTIPTPNPEPPENYE